eukprot:SAG31_NODE_1179_length_9530_cov_8.153748_11_plen_57_part_00
MVCKYIEKLKSKSRALWHHKISASGVAVCLTPTHFDGTLRCARAEVDGMGPGHHVA